MEIIRFQCSCGKKIKVAARFAGQEGNCPACGAGFIVPNPAASDAAEQVSDAPDYSEQVGADHIDSDELGDLANVVQQQAQVERTPWGHPSAAPPRPRGLSALPPPMPPPLLPVPPQSRAAHVDRDGLGNLVNAAQQSAQLERTPIHRPTAARIRAKGSSRTTAILICCAIAAGVAIIAIGVAVRVVSRMHSNSEVSGLIVAAKDAHANGRLEEAVELLHKASREFDADDRDEVRDLLREYEKELGRKQEPQVAQFIAAARAAMASGDNAKAISLLTQATDFSFFNAPNRTEAQELLKQLKPPEQPAVVSGNDNGPAASPHDAGTLLTMQNYQRLTDGMSLSEVEAIIGPGRERASSQAHGLIGRTDVKIYAWQEGLRNISVTFINNKLRSRVQVGLSE